MVTELALWGANSENGDSEVGMFPRLASSAFGDWGVEKPETVAAGLTECHELRQDY